MYVLCMESPCEKKTPKIYEMDRRNICPVCGEFVKISIFNLAIKGETYATGSHVISKTTNILMLKKKLILSHQTLKGATK